MLLFMGKIACATGHRPDKFDFGYNETDIRCINLKKCLKLKKKNGENHGEKARKQHSSMV